MRIEVWALVEDTLTTMHFEAQEVRSQMWTGGRTNLRFTTGTHEGRPIKWVTFNQAEVVLCYEE